MSGTNNGRPFGSDPKDPPKLPPPRNPKTGLTSMSTDFTATQSLEELRKKFDASTASSASLSSTFSVSSSRQSLPSAPKPVLISHNSPPPPKVPNSNSSLLATNSSPQPMLASGEHPSSSSLFPKIGALPSPKLGHYSNIVLEPNDAHPNQAPVRVYEKADMIITTSDDVDEDSDDNNKNRPTRGASVLPKVPVSQLVKGFTDPKDLKERQSVSVAPRKPLPNVHQGLSHSTDFTSTMEFDQKPLQSSVVHKSNTGEAPSLPRVSEAPTKSLPQAPELKKQASGANRPIGAPSNLVIPRVDEVKFGPRKGPMESPMELKIRSRVADRVAKFSQLAGDDQKGPKHPRSKAAQRESAPVSSDSSPARFAKPPAPKPKQISELKPLSPEASPGSSDEKALSDSEDGEDIDEDLLRKRKEQQKAMAARIQPVEEESPAPAPPPQASMDDNLVSYVVCIGLDRPKVFELEDHAVMSKNFFDYLYGTSLPMKELSIVPSDKKALKDYPPGLNLFVFPMGPKLLPKKTSAYVHQFVLTMGNGLLLYGSAVCTFTPGDTNELLYFRSLLGQYLLDNPDAETDLGQMPDAFYVPTALVVLSAHPFHNMMLTVLQEFVSLNCQNGIMEEHAAQLYQLMCKPLPFAGASTLITIDRTLSPLSFSIPDFSSPPLCDVNFKIFFKCLEPRHIITAFNALLSELPVLFITSQVEILCPVSEALLALLYPMKWPFLYIPVLPYSLVDVVQAPQPFLIGCHRSLLASSGPVPHCYVIDLDKSKVVSPTQGGDLNVLPWRLTWRLFSSITRYMNVYEIHHPNDPIEKPDNLPETATIRNKKEHLNSTLLGGVHGVMNYEDMQDLFSGSDPDDSESKSLVSNLSPLCWIDPGNFELGANTRAPALETTFSSEYSIGMKSFSEESFSSEKGKTSRLPTLGGLGKRSSGKARKTNFLKSSTSGKQKHKPSSDDVGDVSIQESEQADEAPTLRMDVVRLRKGFVSIFVSLLSGYREFIKIGEDEMDNEEFGLFDAQAFLAESDDAKRKFVERFVSTQMFDYFVQERVTRKNADWFDNSCLRKLKHDVTNLQKNASRQKMGGLWKKGANFKTWKWRLFILNEDMTLEYLTPSNKLNRLFEQKRELEQRLILNLSDPVKVKVELDAVKSKIQQQKDTLRKGVIQLIEGVTEVLVPETFDSTYRTAYPFEVLTRERLLVLCATDADDRRDWIRLIRAKTQKNRQVLFKRFLPSAKQAARLLRGTSEAHPYQSAVKNTFALALNNELRQVIQDVENSYSQ